MGKLEGRVAILAGGSGYLGGGIATHLAREGASIVIADITDGSKNVNAVKEVGQEAFWVETNVTSKDSTEHMAAATLERFGRIDVLVNMAAIVAGMQKPWLELTPELWQRHMDVDLMGMLLCAQAVYPTMKAAKYGRIVNFSSALIEKPNTSMLHYVSAKAGVIGFTRALATELGDDGICVNAVIPGFFPNESLGPFAMATENLEGQKAKQAIKITGMPEDLAPAIGFFASEEARYITGQALAVDGGEFRVGG